jgi:hypothetical protein
LQAVIAALKLTTAITDIVLTHPRYVGYVFISCALCASFMFSQSDGTQPSPHAAWPWPTTVPLCPTY